MHPEHDNTTSVDVSEKIDRFDVVPYGFTNTVFGLDTLPLQVEITSFGSRGSAERNDDAV